MFNYIDTVKNSYNKLIVITNKQTIKNICNYMDAKWINLNIDLAEKLLDYPIKKRSNKVADLTQDIISEYSDEIIIITGIEVLFSRHLNVSCIDLLKISSRNKVLIVEWPGEYIEGTLIYAKGHLEEFKYKVNNEFMVMGG